jgi:CHAT domain-containing protein
VSEQERRLRWSRILCIALIAIVSIFGVRLRISRLAWMRVTNEAVLRSELLSKLGGLRLVSGRLKDFPYARLGASKYIDYSGLAALSRRAKSLPRTAQALDIIALINLADRRYEASLTLLEEARTLDPYNVTVLADLSALYLEVAAVRNSSMLAYKAILISDLAVKAAPKLLEPRFNRALALKYLYLDDQERKEWDLYLVRDTKSSWAAEARAHLARRESQTDCKLFSYRDTSSLLEENYSVVKVSEYIDSCRQSARLFGERLLGEWGRQNLVLGAKTVRLSKVVDTLAQSLKERGGDSLLWDSIENIRSVSAARNQGKLLSLAQGLSLYLEGLQVFESGRFSSAKLIWIRSLALLKYGTSPFAKWLTFYIAVCDYQESRYDEALHALYHLVRDKMVTSRYLAVAGRAFWVIGLIGVVRGDLTQALQNYGQAVSLFREIREEENLGAVCNLLAQAYRYIGDNEASWRYRREALARLAGMVELSRKQSVFQELVSAACDSGGLKFALETEDEILGLARESPNLYLLVSALRKKSEILQAMGSYPEALRSLREAESVASTLSDAGLRYSISGDLFKIKGELLTGRPNEAIAMLSAALQSYKGTDYVLHIPSAYVLRSRAYRSIGQSDLAEKDLVSAMLAIERFSLRIQGEEAQRMYRDQIRKVFLESAVFFLEGKDYESALDCVERGHAQLLLQLIRQARMGKRIGRSNRVRASHVVERVRTSIPLSTALIEYEIDENRLLIWAVTNRGAKFISIPTSKELLGQLVVNFRQEIVRDGNYAGRASIQLFDNLIRPVLGSLDDVNRLIIVPDDCLYSVSFSALYDSVAAKALIARFGVGVVPSASVYLELLAKPTKRSFRHIRALLVGGPVLKRGSQLTDIPASRCELIGLSRYFDRAEILVGEKARRSLFLKHVKDAELVHVASHSSQEGSFAEIVLSPESGARVPGTLSGTDISGIDLSKVRLVFLAACGTADGHYSNSEGVLSLTRIFMAKGVPSTIATLWNIEDKAASKFSASFYGHLDYEGDPLIALRSAQLEMVNSRDDAIRSPAFWAAFEAFGVGNRYALIRR